MMSKFLFAIVFLALASVGSAEPLAQMAGVWSGSGWARETKSGPKEALRCRLSNTFDAGVLTISGRCAVPSRKIALAGELRSTKNSERITGHWFNPDGLGSVSIVGVQRGDAVAFTFRAKDPKTQAEVAHNVEWRVTGDSLRMRSNDRAEPSIAMSDVTFIR